MPISCISCRPASEEQELIFETPHWKVTLTPKQAYLGRSWVTLKRHCGDLAELTGEEWLDFAEVVKRFEAALRKTFNASMFNWTCLMNEAYQSSPPDPHVHWHVRPRYGHAVKFGGLTFEDPEFRHHYSRERQFDVSREVLGKIREKIEENVQI